MMLLNNPLALDDARQRINERLQRAAADALADAAARAERTAAAAAVVRPARVYLANGLRSLALRLDPALTR